MFWFYTEGILVPAPFYGGFARDLGQRAGVVLFPVELTSKVGLLPDFNFFLLSLSFLFFLYVAQWKLKQIEMKIEMKKILVFFTVT